MQTPEPKRQWRGHGLLYWVVVVIAAVILWPISIPLGLVYGWRQGKISGRVAAGVVGVLVLLVVIYGIAPKEPVSPANIPSPTPAIALVPSPSPTISIAPTASISPTPSPTIEPPPEPTPFSCGGLLEPGCTALYTWSSKVESMGEEFTIETAGRYKFELAVELKSSSRNEPDCGAMVFVYKGNDLVMGQTMYVRKVGQNTSPKEVALEPGVLKFQVHSGPNECTVWTFTVTRLSDS